MDDCTKANAFLINVPESVIPDFYVINKLYNWSHAGLGNK